MKTSKTSKHYFNFKLAPEQSENRVVCFSPEKRKLIANISEAKDTVEIKKYKKGDTNDIFSMIDFSPVKRTKLFFKATDPPNEFHTIASINNECSLYEIVNVVRYLYNLSNLRYAERNGVQLKLQQASLNDKLQFH